MQKSNGRNGHGHHHRVALEDELVSRARQLDFDGRYLEHRSERLNNTLVAAFEIVSALDGLAPDQRARVLRELGPRLAAHPAMPQVSRAILNRPLEETPAVTLDALRFGELIERLGDEPVRWIVDGWLPAGTFSVLGGRPGAGKSLAMYSLAAALGSGGNGMFAGVRVPNRPTLIIQAEEPWPLCRARCDAAGIRRDGGAYLVNRWGDDDASKSARAFDVSHRAHREELERLIRTIADREGEPPVVFLDSIGKLTVAESDDRDTLRDVAYSLADVAESSGATILAISHLRKRPQGGGKKADARPEETLDDLFGSTYLAAAASAVWFVTEQDQFRSELRCLKLRHDRPPSPETFRREHSRAEFVDAIACLDQDHRRTLEAVTNLSASSGWASIADVKVRVIPQGGDALRKVFRRDKHTGFLANLERKGLVEIDGDQVRPVARLEAEEGVDR